MPKYTSDIVAGYTLYFTSKCIVEAMHVHGTQSGVSTAILDIKQDSTLYIFH